MARADEVAQGYVLHAATARTTVLPTALPGQQQRGTMKLAGAALVRLSETVTLATIHRTATAVVHAWEDATMDEIADAERVVRIAPLIRDLRLALEDAAAPASPDHAATGIYYCPYCRLPLDQTATSWVIEREVVRDHDAEAQSPGWVQRRATGCYRITHPGCTVVLLPDGTPPWVER